MTKSKYNLLTFLMIAFYAGARKGAIMELEWNQTNFEKNEISFNKAGYIQTKKRKARTPMASQLRKHLLKRKALYGYRSEFVFHRQNHPHIHVESVDRGFETAVEMAGLKDVTPHILKHTRASLMIQGGVHMKVISEILDMTIETLDKIYAHISRDQLNEMADWMGRTGTMRSQNVRTSFEAKRQNTRKSAK